MFLEDKLNEVFFVEFFKPSLCDPNHHVFMTLPGRWRANAAFGPFVSLYTILTALTLIDAKDFGLAQYGTP